ncbi:PREDICTED: uncharacterized protein LOC109590031 [Amphimedon queenslandica]|uniref:Death domain-containing protein n=1 Tax=Amphimedon queenslandica TaxID=400682 RepID=A0AAN0JXB6_AMPQE|nr:PREDICTED: uncharacterized protein LOC109590031 [Amphimedon queenslandica]|eukprot:XP_019861554.1 PREDICTED: uncharacterized protein LOC109590031 [Amphimedon queenslandica]
MKAVMKIFQSSDYHYLTIGTGLGVNTADLIEMQGTANTKLHLVFQRWFDADRDVNWDTLIKLCDDFPDQLGRAKSILLAYIGSPSYGITTPFKSKANEEEVCKSFDELYKRFFDLADSFNKSLQEKIEHNSQLATQVSEWLIKQMDWEYGSVESNLDDILRKIHPYYDFIDCKLLLDMSIKFLPDVTITDDGVTYKLVDELYSHNRMSKRLCTSNTVSTLQKLLEEHYKPLYKSMDNLPCINIHLQTRWNHISIRGLYKLIEKLLPQKDKQPKYRQLIIKHITIRSKCVVIKLYILDITADSLIEYARGKLQFMRQ